MRVTLDPSLCPHLQGFNPLEPSHVTKPYGHLARARAEAPVFYSPEFDMWIVTRYDEVREVLRDTDSYSSAKVLRTPDVPERYRDRMAHFPVEQNLVVIDPPEHDPIRKLAQKGFTISAVKAREPDVRARAHELIDRFVADGRVDIVREYCDLVPMMTAASMLGVTPDDETIEKLRTWTRSALTLMLEPNDEERILALAEDMLAFDVYIRDLIAQRRAEPIDDVLSLLVHATDEGGQLTEKQLVETAAVILVGGSDTTSGLIARSIQQLLEVPERWARLREDPSLAPAIVEETLRMYGTVMGVVRVATRDVEIDGHAIPEGSWVYISLASADRDDAVFSDPETFDVGRSKSEQGQHLAFGRGTHFCLGATFARAEGRLALEVLVERIPDLRLADPDAPLDIFPSLFVSGLQHLDVVWDV